MDLILLPVNPLEENVMCVEPYALANGIKRPI
jgi:hypothetical protein